MKTCLCGCGAPIAEHFGRGRHQDYASRACKQRAYRARQPHQAAPTVSNSTLYALRVLMAEIRLDQALAGRVAGLDPDQLTIRLHFVGAHMQKELTPAIFAELLNICEQLRAGNGASG